MASVADHERTKGGPAFDRVSPSPGGRPEIVIIDGIEKLPIIDREIHMLLDLLGSGLAEVFEDRIE